MFAPYLLLVEDNHDDVLLTLRTLRVNHCPLITRVVHDGVQALEFLQAAATLPVAILLDPHLPRIDGAELIRHLREDERTANLPILLMTGTEDECRRLSTGSEGSVLADGCLSKPVEWTVLARALRRWGLLPSTVTGVGRETGGNAPSRRLF